MSYDIYLFEPRDGESVEDAYELAVEGKGGEGPDSLLGADLRLRHSCGFASFLSF